jgi:hypothetical protein
VLSVSFNAFNLLDPVNNTHVDVQDDHFTVVREIGAAGAVLLKNERNALPIKIGKGGVRSMTLVGSCYTCIADRRLVADNVRRK